MPIYELSLSYFLLNSPAPGQSKSIFSKLALLSDLSHSTVKFRNINTGYFKKWSNNMPLCYLVRVILLYLKYFAKSAL